jgi:hypothetical protein
MQQSVCPHCDTIDSPLTRCKQGHVYCDGCALVRMLGADEEHEDDCSAFCPLCVPPPQEFVCPITHELMNTPVVAQDGFTYEKSAIEGWMDHRKASPKTNQPMEPIFFPNFNLKALIAEWKLLHGGAAAGGGA